MAAVSPQKTYGISRKNCMMHIINLWLKAQFKKTKNNEWLYWRAFAKQASSLVPSTTFKFLLAPEIPSTSANRMAKEYLVYRAVYLNLIELKQFFGQLYPSNGSFVKFTNNEELCLFLAVSAIKYTEV